MNKQQIRTAVWTFVLTVILLTVILCGVRVDAATRYVLHGAQTTTTVWRDRLSETADTVIASLPASAGLLATVLRAESTAVTTLVYTLSGQIT